MAPAWAGPTSVQPFGIQPLGAPTQLPGTPIAAATPQGRLTPPAGTVATPTPAPTAAAEAATKSGAAEASAEQPQGGTANAAGTQAKPGTTLTATSTDALAPLRAAMLAAGLLPQPPQGT
jgi:hypothetical protein